MESSFTFMRVRGIPIGAHWSWIFVFGLIVYSLTTALFPQTNPGLSDTTYIWMGIVTSVLFFASILLHELGHAFRALDEGMAIDGITLWLFGGVARFKGMFPSPGAEFRIAAAGPVVSVVLAVVFYGLWFGLRALDGPESALGIAAYLARINAIVVAFNLVPALPLDGGRILRAWLWHRQRSFAAASHSAARAGKIFGGVLAAVGLLNFFAGGTTGGLWLVFLGWFLIQAAQAESAMVVVSQALGGRRIRDLMTPQPDTVDPDVTVSEFVEGVARSRGHSTYPVVADGRAIGLMSLRLASAIDPEERLTTRVRDVMLPSERVLVLEPQARMLDVLDDLQQGPRRALVEDDGRLVGIVSVSDVARAIEVQEAAAPAAERGARRAGVVVWIVVGLAIAAAGAFLYHPPVVVLEPGASFDVTRDIEISGTETTAVNGAYLLTSVRLEQRTGLGVLLALLSDTEEVVPAGAVIPEGVDPEQYARQQREIFDQSRRLAAAAAAQAVGMEVEINGTGALVQSVVPGSPAAEVLEGGDVIVEIDGERVEVATDVQQLIRARPAGTSFDIVVQRNGQRRTVTVQSTRLPETVESAPVIGVVLGTRDFDISLPFEIEFEERSIGGPSAGLAYALAIADLLAQQDYADGRKVAATGTVEPGGAVGPIGGLELKVVAVKRAGASLFLVPQSEVEAVEDAEGIDVRGVGRLQEALRALERTARG